jgi:peptidoglycan/xylan/chitin deacetylase (PgdA/CDA1 family)
MRIKRNKNGLTVVMYHHIVVRKKYFNGISFAKFKKQITYFKKNYNILNPKEFYEKLKKKTFNNKDLVITFDDGYQSQYQYAFDFLNTHNLKAFFFPMVLGYNSNKIHQVNKIHLLLKLNKNKKKLFEKIKFLIK